jgi:predicted enzyme related to lactoylglutathione lyase
VSAPSLRICVDVDDMTRAIAFYAGAFGLRVGRRLGDDWVELLGAPCPIDLLKKASGSQPCEGQVRDYRRHWSPVHLDFATPDVAGAVARAVTLGASLEGEIRVEPYGKIANLADPFGHGFCLIQFSARGYDAII